MPSYRAREPIYLNCEGRLIEAGEVFTSHDTPGLAWIALDSEPPVATTSSPAPRKPASADR
jgi:hypothetical protein